MGISNQKNLKRPSGLTIIAIWYIFFAVYNLISAFGFTAGVFGMWTRAEEYTDQLNFGVLLTTFEILATLFYGGASAIVGFGLWTLKSWAWNAGVIFGILMLPGIPVGTFIGAVTVVYLLKSQPAKEALTKKTNP